MGKRVSRSTTASQGLRRWGCLRSLPLDGDAGEALVSLGGEQWLRLPMGRDDALLWQRKLGQRVGVDLSCTPFRLLAEPR